MPKHSELDKWAKVHDQASAILQFLDWRGYNEARCVGLTAIEQVELYFGIDAKKLEAERRNLLASIQNDPL